MTTTRLLACAPLLLASACASLLPGYRPPAGAIVLTQVGAEQMANCIAQSAGTSATSGAAGYIVDVPEQTGTTQLSIVRDSVQTSVVRRDDVAVETRASQIAVDCAVKLAPSKAPSA